METGVYVTCIVHLVLHGSGSLYLLTIYDTYTRICLYIVANSRPILTSYLSIYSALVYNSLQRCEL